MSRGYRITDYRPKKRRIGDIFDIKNEVSDLTDRVIRMMIGKEIENDFQLFTMTAMGLQGVGKTYFCKYLAFKAYEVFGDRVKIIFTNHLNVAIDQFDEHSIYFIVIDDAAEHHDSKEGTTKAQRIMAKRWFRIRHIAKEVSKSETGRIMIIFNYQRWTSVHPNFRNPQLLFALGPMADTNDIKAIESRVGNIAYECLGDKLNQIEAGDNSFKSNSIVRITSQPIPQGVGWIFGDFIEKWDEWPPFLDHAKYDYTKKKTQADIIDEMLCEDKWTIKAEMHKLYHEDSIDQTKISGKYGVSRSRVSQNISEVKEEITRRLASA